MRTTAMMALALVLAGCGFDRSRVTTAAQTWAAANGGSDTSGAAASVQTAAPSVAPTLTEPADADELAGGAECVTHTGAPYEAPTC
jgi:hypothetical protein